MNQTTTARPFQPDVLSDARRQLDTASRRVGAVIKDTGNLEGTADAAHRRLLTEAIANIHAALARLEGQL